MKKVLFYYSLTGNGEKVAKIFKEKGYEIREVITKRRLPKSFFFLMLVGGFEAGLKIKRPIKEMDYDLKDVDEVVIASPIWNDRLASPINTLLSNLDLKEKTLSFVLYSGSGKGAHAIEKIQKNYDTKTIVIMQEPNKYPDELEKLRSF